MWNNKKRRAIETKLSAIAKKRIEMPLTEMGKTMRGTRFGGEIRSSVLKYPSGDIKQTTRCVILKVREEIQARNVNLRVVRISVAFKNMSMIYVTKECL